MAAEKAKQPGFGEARQERVSEFSKMLQKVPESGKVSAEVKIPETKGTGAIEKQKAELDESIRKEGAELNSRLEGFRAKSAEFGEERRKETEQTAGVTREGEALLHA